MFEYLSYVLSFGLLIIFLIYVYIRVKYGFWVLQPVFHIYDFGYMMKPPGIIDSSLPAKNKYTNFREIDTIVISDLTSIQRQRFVNLIKANYLQNKDNIFSPQSENVLPYFIGHNDKSFISFFYKDDHMIDLKKGTTITDRKIIGAMTSRPLHIIINNGDKDAKFDAYYVDYLCVDKLHRKKGIAPQLIFIGSSISAEAELFFTNGKRKQVKISGSEIATLKVPDGVRSVTFTKVGKGIYGAGLIATKSGYGYFPLAAGSLLTKSSVPLSNIRVLTP